MCGGLKTVRRLEGDVGDLRARWVADNSCVLWTCWKPDLNPLLSAHVAQKLEKERSIIICKRTSRAQGGKQQLLVVYQHIKQLYSLSVRVTVNRNFVE